MISAQMATDISKLIRIELSYQLQNKLSHLNLTPEQFSRRYEIPMEIVSSVLKQETVSVAEMGRICSWIGVSIDSLKYPPSADKGYRTMKKLLKRSAAKCSDFYEFAMGRYPYIDSSLPKNEYERNIAWIDFENKYKGRTPNRLKKWTVKLCAHFLPRHIAVGLVSGLVKQELPMDLKRTKRNIKSCRSKKEK